jgi:geranylgeranyl diphosphate synthase type II
VTTITLGASLSGPALVEATLEHDRLVTLRALLEYLPNDFPHPELYSLASDYPLRGGKGMRPSLCLAACRAHGGATDDAVDSAVALELLHNAFLVHDDIEDGSRARRGRPTLHELHGLPLALNAGDALTVLSQAPLLANVSTLGTSLALAVMGEFHHLGLRTIEGQAMELLWRREGRSDLTSSDYLTMVLGKTCWYSTIHPLRIGAMIGSRGRVDVDRFNELGFLLGATFQVHDDLDNLTDRSSGYGKDFGGDVLEGKPTLPLIHLLSVCAADERREIDAIVGRGEPDGAAWVIDLMERHGSIDVARSVAAELSDATVAELDRAFAHVPASQDVEFIRALAVQLGDTRR